MLNSFKKEVEEVATEFKKDTKKDTTKRETIKRKKLFKIPKPVLEGK